MSTGCSEEAQRSTGLDDLGPDAWREGADRLVDALNTEAALNELGGAIASAEIADYLSNRLRIVDWAKQNPEISEAEIRPPIVILGQPRTGTTILVRRARPGPGEPRTPHLGGGQAMATAGDRYLRDPTRGSKRSRRHSRARSC